MSRYTVRIEINVDSFDFADVEVEAFSPEEARQLASKQYTEDASDMDFYSSDCLESSLRTESIDEWRVVRV